MKYSTAQLRGFVYRFEFVFCILPIGMMKLWYSHLAGRSRRVVYLDKYVLVSPENWYNLCSGWHTWQHSYGNLYIDSKLFCILPIGMMKLWYSQSPIWALKTSSISWQKCAREPWKLIQSALWMTYWTAQLWGFVYRFDVIHILPIGMMKLWYSHLTGRSRRVVYLDKYVLVSPEN